MHEMWEQLGGFGKLLVTWEMLRLPKLSPRAVFTRRDPRGVLDDDLLPERCDITSPTIASTDSVLKFKLDGSLLEFIWLGVDIQNTIQRFKKRNYSQWRRKCSQSVKVSKVELELDWVNQLDWCCSLRCSQPLRCQAILQGYKIQIQCKNAAVKPSSDTDEAAKPEAELKSLRDCGETMQWNARSNSSPDFERLPWNSAVKIDSNGSRYGGDGGDQRQGLGLMSNWVQTQAQEKPSWVQTRKKSKYKRVTEIDTKSLETLGQNPGSGDWLLMPISDEILRHMNDYWSLTGAPKPELDWLKLGRPELLYETDLVNLFQKRNSNKAAWQISKPRTPGSRLQKAVIDQNRRDGAGDDMEATL